MPIKCVIPASFLIKLELPHQMTEVVNPFLPAIQLNKIALNVYIEVLKTLFLPRFYIA